jgi:hypothetical protein
MSERKRDEPDSIQQILKAGALYFSVVFGAGFVLGTIRTLWVLPSFGARRAELMEATIILAITVLHRDGWFGASHTSFVPWSAGCRLVRAWPLASFRIHRRALD